MPGLLLLLSVWWASCKKGELPPPIFDTPVFRVQYTLSGNSDSVVAGLDNRYLFTRYEQSDFITCSGAFAPVSCPDADCPGSLGFEFRSETTDIFEPDSVFATGNYTYLGTDSASSNVVFRTTFTAKSSGGYSNFFWWVDSLYTGSGPVFQVDFPEESPKSVQLVALKPSGLQGRIDRAISLIDTVSKLYPDIAVFASFDSLSGIYQLTAESLGAPYDFLAWNNGDSSKTIESDVLESSYRVTVSSFGGAIQTIAGFEELSVQDLPVQTPGFSYQVETIFVPLSPGTVAIQWVDAQGQTWRSDRGQQPVDAYFIVSKSESYDLNENGQNTRKMEVSFNCMLFDNNGEARLITGTGVIAVAHP